jgi:hypothetical protein
MKPILILLFVRLHPHVLDAEAAWLEFYEADHD